MNTPALATQSQNLAVNLFNAEQFEMTQRLCKMYVNSDLVPESYKVSDKRTADKAIANCMIAVCMAQRMGADHLMVMQNLDIIQGRPSFSAKFLIAMVNSCGRFEPLRYKFDDLGILKDTSYIDYEWQNNRKVAITRVLKEEIHNIQCIAFTSEKGSGEILESTPITMEMAIKEGWYSKAGSKWQTMPKLMLQYRAASFWQRAYSPEISMGLSTQEEARDVVDVEYTEVSDASAKLKEELNRANAEEFRSANEFSRTAPEPSTKQPDPVITEASDNKPPFM